MSLLDTLRRLFVGSSYGSSGMDDPNGLYLYFRCNNCGSVVRIRAHKYNDPNREDGPGAFVLRKDVMDDKCFRMMSAEVWLDENYRVVEAEVNGGKLISADEYETARTKVST